MVLSQVSLEDIHKKVSDHSNHGSYWPHPIVAWYFVLFRPTYYLRQWNEVNIGGDYEIGRSVRVSVCVCVHDDCAGTVAPSCENFYIGGDIHSRERLLVSNG